MYYAHATLTILLVRNNGVMATHLVSALVYLFDTTGSNSVRGIRFFLLLGFCARLVVVDHLSLYLVFTHQECLQETLYTHQCTFLSIIPVFFYAQKKILSFQNNILNIQSGNSL